MEKRLFYFFLSSRNFLYLLFLLGIAMNLFGDGVQTQVGLKSWQKAQWLREQGRYEESLKILEEEIQSKYSEDKTLEKAICWQNIGLNYWNLGEVDKAQNSFVFILALLKDRPDDAIREYARTAIEIIRLYKEAKSRRSEKKYEESEQLFLKAIRIARKNKMKEFELKNLRHLGLLYWIMNQFENLFKVVDRALKIAKEINHHLEECYALNQLGIYHLRKNDYRKAYEFFDKAVYLAEKENKLDLVPECLDNLGLVYYYFGNYELSEGYFKKALKIYEKENDTKNIITDLFELAIIFYKKQKVNQSVFNFDEILNLMFTALELSHKIGYQEFEPRILNNIGFIYLDNDLRKAEDFSRQAWQKGRLLQDKEVIASSLNNLATIYLRRNQIDRALATFKQSLKVALEIDYWNEVWKDYSGIAQCYERLRKFDQALQIYQKALKVFEKIRETIALDLHKISFDREKREVYEGIIRALVSLKERTLKPDGYNELIFASINQIKARAFLEGLIQINDDDQPEKIAERLSQIDQQISELLTNPENMQNEEVSKKLLELEYRYFRILGEGNGLNHKSRVELSNQLNLSLVQKELLDDGQVLLDYYLGQEESYCFLISRDDYRIIKLPAEKDIENSIKLYIKLLAEPSIEQADLFSAGFRIASLLIPPIKDLGDKVTSLVIIPDGLLNYLPFESLVLEDCSDQDRKKYLVKKFRISYAPSIAAFYKFKKLPERNGYRKELLAFGNPYYDSKEQKRARSLAFFLNGQTVEDKFSLSPLPYTQQEIKEIARLFSRSNYDLFLKKKATEDKLKSLNLKDYRILHFACHGLVSENFPQRSCLVFSLRAGTREDGFLTVREIYNLKLKAELVVLSACETSRGAMEKVEGIIGLPRAFLLSGSQAVVSSLWSVNDRATQELMKEFYQFLLAGDSKDEALRKAKLKMIHSGKSHPYYWAAFILTGNSGKIY